MSDNGGNAWAATDFEDATNSVGMGKSTTACAFSESVIEGLSNSENHWEATTVLGDSGSDAFAFSIAFVLEFVALFLIHCFVIPSMIMRLLLHVRLLV